MSEPFEILSKEYIVRWLKSLVKKGGSFQMRDGPTQIAVARYLGIPRNTLTCITHFPTSGGLTVDLTRRLSKLIAQVENGQLVFERKDNYKVARLVDKPAPPVVRYQVQVGAKGLTLGTVARPKAFKAMPTFKDAVLTPTKRTTNL